MAQRPRKRQPNGRVFVMVQTQTGPLLYKLCAGPCCETKPIVAFYRVGETRRSWCKACEAPGIHIRGTSEKRKARQREYQRKRYEEKKKTRVQRQGCVYVIQLMMRANIIKIGSTVRLSDRLSDLRRQYGDLRLLFVLPIEHHRNFEQYFHTCMKGFRLYEGAQKSELFHLKTKAARKSLGALMEPYPSCVVALPVWDISPQGVRDSQQQLKFF
jgi:hypothetical protein